MRISLITSLIVALLAVAFALVNHETVTVNLGLTQVQGSLALVILVTLFLGVLVGILASLPGRIRARKRINALKKQLNQQLSHHPPEKADESSSATPSDE